MDPSDAALLRAAADDQEAFGVFYRRHRDVVLRFAVRRCATPDDVADVVAETFLAAYRGAGRYRAEFDSARPWLLGIARRVVLRQRRSLARRLRLVGRAASAATAPRFVADEHEAVDAAIDAARRRPELTAALAGLPAAEREVLELVAEADLTPAEAARALGLTPNAARLRLSRARRRLRRQLDPPTSAPAEVEIHGN
jgi:RNA polymerase sigma-70 factor (ECF subfamily)